jgi:hypothetical protein
LTRRSRAALAHLRRCAFEPAGGKIGSYVRLILVVISIAPPKATDYAF